MPAKCECGHIFCYTKEHLDTALTRFNCPKCGLVWGNPKPKVVCKTFWKTKRSEVEWKIQEVVWDKYRIHREEKGTWTVIHVATSKFSGDGGPLYKDIPSLAEAKKKAEQYETMYSKDQQKQNIELRRLAVLS